MTVRDASLPRGWAWTTLGEITESSVEQGPPAGAEFRYVDISSNDRRAKRITEPKILPAGKAPTRARQHLRVGDVVVSMTRPNLNAIAKVPSSMDKAVGPTGFHVLRSRWVSPDWLLYLVQTNAFIEAMTRIVQGVVYPAVRPKNIEDYRVPFPPLAEQRRIVAEVERRLTVVGAHEASVAASLKRATRLRQAILKRAFSGRLVPQDPADEPASALLARIRAERAAAEAEGCGRGRARTQRGAAQRGTRARRGRPPKARAAAVMK